MPSVRCLREFVSERLTAAAEEIFKFFETTVIEYEKEIARQRKLLDIAWKPDITLHRLEVPEQYTFKEEQEVLANHQLCNQERTSSLAQENPEPPQVKEEQEEFCTSQEEEQFEQRQGTDTFLLTTYEESDTRQTLHMNTDETMSLAEKASVMNTAVKSSVVPEPNSDFQLLSLHPHVPESQDHKGATHGDSVSTSNAEPSLNERHHSDSSPMPNNQCITNTGKKAVKCNTCGKTYKYLSKLIVHLRSHTGEKPYFCVACGRRFVDSSSLKRHMITHTGERTFCCNTCGKTFFHASTLKGHMRVHTGERPHFCNTCGKKFTTTSGLNAHIKIHTDERPFMCKTCGRNFRRGSVLIRHIRTHTGERPYVCYTCGRRFKDTSCLRRHKRIHTPKNL
uniref:zinc finger protein 771-like n=1 Tax=Monopterus albus TaxID=43700 RepID=UPI0009B33B87|nr:zinc finger protein 771-like [Monopterus albus]